VRPGGDQRHDHERGEQPPLDELLEWKVEEIESRVASEDRVGDPERDAAGGTPQLELLPPAGHSGRCEHAEQSGDSREHPPGVGLEGHTIPLHVLLLRRVHAVPRPDGPDDEKVHVQKDEERRAENEREVDSRPKHRPEHARQPDLAEPQDVDVEARERGEQDCHRRDPEDEP
jgi:hypothetical protein